MDPDGSTPLRSAATNSASAPAISSPAPGGTSAAPSRLEVTRSTPSHVALPPAPTARHSPFHDVSSPSAHQLPL